jgi:FMN-dependent NADH-azoreductase
LDGFATQRDLASDPLPQVDGAWADARPSNPVTRSPDDTKILDLSDILVAELQAADTIVIDKPVYNFGSTASFKTWIDLVASTGIICTYSDKGPKALSNGKRAIIMVRLSAPRLDLTLTSSHHI